MNGIVEQNLKPLYPELLSRTDRLLGIMQQDNPDVIAAELAANDVRTVLDMLIPESNDFSEHSRLDSET